MKRSSGYIAILVVVSAVWVCWDVSRAYSADPGATCAAAKQKAAAKKLDGKVKCHGVAMKKGLSVDPACLSKAESKFTTAFAKAELKGGCATTGDAATIEALVDSWLSDVLAALPASGSTTTTTLPPSTCDTLGDCNACVACAQQPGEVCAGATAACGADPECAALGNCLNLCGDQACVDACYASHPSGQAAYDAWLACIVGACSVSCGL